MTNNRDTLKAWNTIDEVAQHLRVSPRTVARRIRAGLLHTRKDGHLVRIRRERVWQFERTG